MTAHRTTTTRGRAGAGASERPKLAILGPQRLILDPIDPKLVQRLSANSRAQSHWPRTNAKNAVKDRVFNEAVYQRLRPFAVPVSVTFRWIVPTRGRRDLDNLASNGIVKASLDALVEGRWLADDSSQWVREVRTEMEYERGRRALEITLAPVEER